MGEAIISINLAGLKFFNWKGKQLLKNCNKYQKEAQNECSMMLKTIYTKIRNFKSLSDESEEDLKK